MNKIYLIVSIIFVIAVIGFVAVNAFTQQNTAKSIQPVACTMEAKLCPDGSAVGREGPNCEFAACPSTDVTSPALVSVAIGDTATALGVSVSPQALVSDSRCPEDVACIWAGTVEVKTLLTTPVSHGEHTLTLEESQRFGDYSVTLVGVTPKKTEGTIAEASYSFTFEIERN